MKRKDFSKGTNMSEAWRKLGVPTVGISQATRWHDNAAGVWTLWIDNPEGTNFERRPDGRMVLTPWDYKDKELTAIRRGKADRYWDDLRLAAEQGRSIRIMALKWKRDVDGKFVEDQHGAAIPLFWFEARATCHEDGHRIVLEEAS